MTMARGPEVGQASGGFVELDASRDKSPSHHGSLKAICPRGHPSLQA
jgi:hypothetical protein